MVPFAARMIAFSLAGLGLAISGGCLSVLPSPKAPQALIALPSDRAGKPEASLSADVTIYPPDASRAYAGSDIAVRSDEELVFLADVRWADAAPRLLQGGVMDSLSKASGEGRALSAQQGGVTDYDLRWRIIDLSVSKGTGAVRAEVEASIVDSSTRRIVSQERFSADERPRSGGARDRAAALALTSQAVCDRVAGFVARSALPKKRQLPPSAASSNK
ncbi:MAG: membrane integrity-associated transporter subunit PqiC [Alphaproteobacteria bacterium]|nr:membrane integrity-associated transporter subunit PqiC [Alphaproteobacteria bacterium]